MARPHFSDMLVERRQALGLSLPQAANALRMKERVLQAFEEGSFPTMPKTGYAQGMISSYARYLGLDPKVVVDQYCEDLYEFENGVSSHELRRRTRESRQQAGAPNPGQDQRTGVLPRDKMASRADAQRQPGATRHATDRASRQQTGPAPLVTPRPYVSAASSVDRYPQGRPYNSGTYATRGTDVRDGAASRSQAAAQYQRARSGSTRPVESMGTSAEDVTTRRVRPRQYTDDLRYNETPSPYNPASTSVGRQSSRNIASTERPNVRRRQAPPAPARPSRPTNGRGRGRGGARGGVSGFFSDSRRATLAIVAILGIVLLLIIVFSVRSCASSKTTSASTKQVSVVTTAATSSSTTTQSESQKAAEEAALVAASAKAQASSQAAAATETQVTVTVADGAVSWVEITSDGQSLVAETVTGPWTKTYVVTQSTTIQVGDTKSVTVTKNGSTVQFDSKTSGIGSVTIQGTSTTATSATTATAATTSAN